MDDIRYKKFKEHYESDKGTNDKIKNVWILKPGENTNQGNGIMVETKLENIVNKIK